MAKKHQESQVMHRLLVSRLFKKYGLVNKAKHDLALTRQGIVKAVRDTLGVSPILELKRKKQLNPFDERVIDFFLQDENI